VLTARGATPPAPVADASSARSRAPRGAIGAGRSGWSHRREPFYTARHGKCLSFYPLFSSFLLHILPVFLFFLVLCLLSFFLSFLSFIIFPFFRYSCFPFIISRFCQYINYFVLFTSLCFFFLFFLISFVSLFCPSFRFVTCLSLCLSFCLNVFVCSFFILFPVLSLFFFDWHDNVAKRTFQGSTLNFAYGCGKDMLSLSVGCHAVVFCNKQRLDKTFGTLDGV